MAKSLLECLIKYKITTERYQQEFKAFTDLNYTEEQANKIIVRKSSKNTCITLLDLHADLIQYFSREQITSMASHNGGGKNLSAALEHRQKLEEFNCSREQIAKILSHDGGSQNLAALLTHRDALQTLGFSTKQIIKVASHNGGSQNLAALLTQQDALQTLGFTTEQIIKVASHDGGSQNLAALLTQQDALQTLSFSTEQIIKVASHDGGSQNLASVRNHQELLKLMGFDDTEIINMASRSGGSLNLDFLISIYARATCVDKATPIVCSLNDRNIFNEEVELEEKAKEQPFKIRPTSQVGFFSNTAVNELEAAQTLMGIKKQI